MIFTVPVGHGVCANNALLQSSGVAAIAFTKLRRF
jgi:hypothetical protein